MTASPFTADDYGHMARALQLAARGLACARPNPRVGCVLVKASRVIGEGWHAHAGGPHAEVVALRAAGANLASVTIVNVYLRSMKDFADMNEVYATAFSEGVMPARVTVGVAELPKNALVEISCTAYVA